MTERMTAAEFTPGQYGAWRSHPMTVFMFGFFDDKARAFEQEILKRWRHGTLKMLDEAEGRGRVMVLEEIPTTEWNDILVFYGLAPIEQKDEPTEESNGTALNE